MKQLISEGFLNKNNKALRPDKETGKWKGAKTANGNFGTIKPLWSNKIKINNKSHELEVWTFNNKWGKQILFYKLFKQKDEKSIEELL
tara:strand:+ start:886 stop:1149 length:264 start_codon:yes stop_codon:yes gene_type:complete